MSNRPEVLAPAGSFESMKAAVSAGADAVYMGGPRFGARAYAANPDEQGLLEALDYLHFHGRKLYLTVNTLLKEEELTKELYSYLLPLYQRGVDAVIVQDLGVLAFLREHFPELPIHASTQMTVMSPYGARLLRRLGVSRLVLPRELTLSEVWDLCEVEGLEIEVFVHGALCYCYSGQCLLSSLIGGRSGNRGRCAQPCRLPYSGGYPMNLKDLCSLDLLPQILETGVDSLKIEGRMKSPLYTAGVVSVYRRYVDRYLTAGGTNWQVAVEDRRILRELFDRGGTTDGYWRGELQHMLAAGKREERHPDESLRAELEECYLKQEPLEQITGSVRIYAGERARMDVRCGETAVTVLGEEVGMARSRPLQPGEVRERFAKLGGTGYAWENLTIDLGKDAFLPVGAMNRLRREAIETLTGERLHAYQRID